jgi:hypothetical protein
MYNLSLTYTFWYITSLFPGKHQNKNQSLPVILKIWRATSFKQTFQYRYVNFMLIQFNMNFNLTFLVKTKK